MTDMTDEAVKALLAGATPGPWSSDDVAVRLEDKSLVALVYGNGRGSFMANNRLIAAAPDLARALLQARADAAAAQALVGTLTGAAQRLNAACDAMWNDHRRVEAHRIKECHMKAISEAQQALFPALAQTPTDPGDGWTWNERLGWIGPDGKPADPRMRG